MQTQNAPILINPNGKDQQQINRELIEITRQLWNKASKNSSDLGAVGNTFKKHLNNYGDIVIAQDSSIYFGNPFVDGSGRIRYDGTNFLFERRVGGVWV